MKKYVDVEAFLDFEIARCGHMPILGTCSSNNVPLGTALFKFPATKLVEQKHGKWIRNPHSTWMYCSECDEHTYLDDYSFCPHCGAKMD